MGDAAGWRVQARAGAEDGGAGCGDARPSRSAETARSSGDAPSHPGRILDARFLRPGKITQRALAEALGVSRRRVNELVRGHRGITADTAIRLARFFGTEAQFWMDLQSAWDLRRALELRRGRR